MKNILLALSGAAAAAILFTSCGGGGSSSSSGGGGGSMAATGPTSSSAFVGTSVSFNPTVTFTADGQCTFQNIEQNSEFDYEPTPVSGTFTYTPSVNFETGTFTMTFDGETETGYGSDFIVVDGYVTGFTMNFPGKGKYFATVSGQLEAAVVDDPDSEPVPTGAEDFTYQINGNIATGTVFSKTFVSGTQQGNGNTFYDYSPLLDYSPGQSVTFTIASNGNLEFLGSEYYYSYYDYNIYQKISLKVTDVTDGVIRYDGNYNYGRITAIFDTKATTSVSDLSLTFTGYKYFSGSEADTKFFAN